MTAERTIIVWREAIYEVLLCVAPELRAQVLAGVGDKQAAATVRREQIAAADILPAGITLKDMKAEVAAEAEEWDAGEDDDLPPPREARIFEAQSVIVQVLTRTITNHHSAAQAAAILFRPHRERGEGTGSGWLPDYLDNLAGVTIDRAKCTDLARGRRS
jgi:hypothetical protein